jgi:DNA-binding IscR family transcriptional regulator
VSAGWGYRAVILIRLDARAGEWVSVADLAAHMGCSSGLLPPILLELESCGLLATRSEHGEVTAARAELTSQAPGAA